MIEELLRKYAIISDQVDERELRVILRELDAVLRSDIPGDVVEFGCYEGTSSLFIQRLLQKYSSERSLHVYDSFAGLPEKSEEDNSAAGEQFKGGELLASKQNFIRNFKQAGLRLPKIHKAWFSDLARQDVPDKIAYAFLDGDFYESIWSSLKLIENSLQPGAIIVVDDFQSEALPGVAKAVHEWLQNKSYPLKTEASLAVIQITER
jgi:O-methyltransferase